MIISELVQSVKRLKKKQEWHEKQKGFDWSAYSMNVLSYRADKHKPNLMRGTEAKMPENIQIKVVADSPSSYISCPTISLKNF